MTGVLIFLLCGIPKGIWRDTILGKKDIDDTDQACLEALTLCLEVVRTYMDPSQIKSLQHSPVMNPSWGL